MLPGIAYYMSRWYRRSELAFRLSLYIVMAPLAGAFGGLLASGILTLDGVGSLKTWRMIFIIEGIITCGLAIIAFFTLTDRPATARWLSAEERELAIARVKSERVGATEVLDKMDGKKLARGIFNPVVLATSMIFLLDNVTVQGLAFFLPTIVRVSLMNNTSAQTHNKNSTELTRSQTIYPGTTVVHQQLRTVPPYVVGAFFTVMFPFLSWRFDRRNIFLIISAPLIMVGYIMFLASTEGQVRYGATFLITAGAFSFGALCNAQVSANVLSDTARASAIGTNVMFGMFECTALPALLVLTLHRQRRRFDLHMGFRAARCTQLPDRQWIEPGHLFRNSDLEHRLDVLHEDGQQQARQEGRRYRARRVG